MIRLLLLLLASSFPVVALPGKLVQADIANDRIVLLQPLRFSSGTAELDPTASAIVDELAQLLQAQPSFTRIVIEGHTDNQGDDTSNTLLSKARADAILQRLVTKGVSASRLTTRGYGSASPLVGNDTAAGRDRNRRVEILVLEVAGKGTARAAPVAEVAAALNVVRARAPEQPRWQDATIGLDLFRAWRVNTQNDSAAEVSFADRSRAQLRENTLIVIFGLNQYQERSSNVELTEGSLRTRIDELVDGEPLRVDTNAGELLVGRGSALLGVDAAGTNRIANHAGDAVRVKSKKKFKAPTKAVQNQAQDEVDVAMGMGTLMVPGSPPQPPRPLPPPPQWQQPLELSWPAGKVLVAGSMSPTTPPLRHRVEVSAVGQAGVVFMSNLPAAIDRIELRELPYGHYRVAVAAIDVDGLEGAPQVSTIVVAGQPAEPMVPNPSTMAMLDGTNHPPQTESPSLLPVVATSVAVLALSAALAVALVINGEP
jgi:OmpA family/FecR protein